MQLALQLAVGESLFGIGHPKKTPIRVLVVQAENDELEIAEILQSQTADWAKKCPKNLNLLNQNLHIANLWNKTGGEFVRWLRKITDELSIDLVIVDPLLAYIDGNVSDNTTITKFLRGDVNEMLKEDVSKRAKQFGILFVHHTAKPTGKNNSRSVNTQIYDVLGCAELPNWARCIIRLERIEDVEDVPPGLCSLSIPKRGQRAGLCQAVKAGENTCYIKHASQEIAGGRPNLKWELWDDVLPSKTKR